MGQSIYGQVFIARPLILPKLQLGVIYILVLSNRFNGLSFSCRTFSAKWKPLKRFH